MSEGRYKGNELGLLVGICLILFGVWKLAQRVFSPWWDVISGFFSTAIDIIWPLAIIVAGVLVLSAVRKGGFGSRTSGKRLYRSRSNRKIAGVCGGLADYFSIDPATIRIAFLILIFISGATIIPIYLILWIVVPEEPVGTGTWS